MPLRYSKDRRKMLKSVAALQHRGALDETLYRECLRRYRKALRQLLSKLEGVPRRRVPVLTPAEEAFLSGITPEAFSLEKAVQMYANRVKPGATGVVVHTYKKGAAYEVEVLATDGTTEAVSTVDGYELKRLWTQAGQEMKPSERATARAKLAEQFLQDALRPENATHTRYSCAFDSLYLYALAAAQAPDRLKSHPYPMLLSEGAKLLRLDMQIVDRLTLRMRKFGSQLGVTDEQVAELIALATAAQKHFQGCMK